MPAAGQRRAPRVVITTMTESPAATSLRPCTASRPTIWGQPGQSPPKSPGWPIERNDRGRRSARCRQRLLAPWHWRNEDPFGHRPHNDLHAPVGDNFSGAAATRPTRSTTRGPTPGRRGRSLKCLHATQVRGRRRRLHAACGPGRRDGPAPHLLPSRRRYLAKSISTVTVLRCAWDGQTLRYREHGDELTIDDKTRGLHEPSLAHFDGNFYLTIRHDENSFVTRGKDGLHFEP